MQANPATIYPGNADIPRPYTDGTRETARFQLEKAKAALNTVNEFVAATIIRDSNNWYINDPDYDLLIFTVGQMNQELATVPMN